MTSDIFIDEIDSANPQKRRKQGCSRTTTANEQLTDLCSLLDVKNHSNREVLFIKKLHQCCVIFDFMDSRVDRKGKEIKRYTLLELIGYVNTGKGVLTRAVYPEIVRMVSSNLFRVFPPRNEPPDFILDESMIVVDASWPHLALVYEFLLRFLEAPEFQVSEGKKVISKKFVVQLLELLDTEDPSERHSLKNVLHRIYSKFTELRATMRKQINNIFLTFIYETEKFNGIGELLEILSSIINGFFVPLKNEHLQFFTKILLPLHKSRRFVLYHTQLTCCVLQFLDKDPALTEQVVHMLLKYWPKTNSQKEVEFLFEIEEILVLMDPCHFVKLQEPLMKQLAQCLSSPNVHVAEKALSFWKNERIVSLMENKPAVIAIILPALCRTSKEHWNKNIIVQIKNVIKTFKDISPSLLEDLLRYYEADSKKDIKEEGDKDKSSSLDMKDNLKMQALYFSTLSLHLMNN